MFLHIIEIDSKMWWSTILKQIFKFLPVELVAACWFFCKLDYKKKLSDVNRILL